MSFQYNCNEHSESENKKIITCTILLSKTLRNKLKKGHVELILQNNNIKETKEYLKKWKFSNAHVYQNIYY